MAQMEPRETEILPSKPFSFNAKEIWDNRELLLFFAWRDIKVKYKQTYLGILWAILQPTLLMVIFYFIFARALKVDTGSISYPVYAFSGLILWGFFSSGIVQSSESMLSHASIIRKIYFPRLLIPFSTLLVAIVDYLFGFIVLLILLAWFRQPVSWSAIACFPAALLLSLIAALGMGTLLSALNVKFRDFRYLIPFLIQLLFFSSQVLYSLHSLKISWLTYIMYCNPLNGALELFYYPMQPDKLNSTGIMISAVSALIILFSGLAYFTKTEKTFADFV